MTLCHFGIKYDICLGVWVLFITQKYQNYTDLYLCCLYPSPLSGTIRKDQQKVFHNVLKFLNLGQVTLFHILTFVGLTIRKLDGGNTFHTRPLNVIQDWHFNAFLMKKTRAFIAKHFMQHHFFFFFNFVKLVHNLFTLATERKRLYSQVVFIESSVWSKNVSW